MKATEPIVLYPYPFGSVMRVTLALLLEEYGTERWKALERVHQEWKHGKPIIETISVKDEGLRDELEM